MEIGPSELIVVLLIVLVLFGPGRVAKLGGELGVAIHEFRRGLQEGERDTHIEEEKEESNN